MGGVANYIFLHTACHRPTAALGLADPDVVEGADRCFWTKSGGASNRGCLGLGGCSPLSPEIVKLF